jgi:hypothetical protein
MAAVFRVLPGDLITADLFNQILEDIADLNVRLAQLENATGGTGAGQVVIFQPSVGASMRVGEHIEISGLNFGFSSAQQRVLFDQVPVSGFEAGSNDNLLRVVVPSLANIGLGRAAVLSVSNGTATATRGIFVQPPDQPLTGTVDIEARPSEPNPVVPNANADFPFVLSPRGLNRTEEFQVSPVLTGQAWNMQILNAGKSVLDGGRVPLSPDQPTTVYVRLAVPQGVNNQTFSLTLSVASGPVGGSSQVTSYTVGQAPQPSDDTIKLTIGNVVPSTALVSGTIRLAGGGFVSIPIDVLLTQPGGPFRYDLALELIPDTAGGGLATGWTFGFLQPATNPPSQTTATTPNLGATGSLVFAVAVAANASTTGRLRLRVRRQGGALDKTLELNLARTS